MEVVGLLTAFTVFDCPIADLRQGVVAYQLLAVEGDGGEAVDVETLVFGNEDVPFSGRVEVWIVVVQSDGGKYGLLI